MSHIRSTQERLCDERIKTRLKQNQEVKEQREDETKRSNARRRSISSDEEEMKTRRQVKKCESQDKKCEIKTKCPDLKGSAENSTSFLSSFQQEFLSMSSEFTFGDNSDEVSIFRFFL